MKTKKITPLKNESVVSVHFQPQLQKKVKARAKSLGLSVSAYLRVIIHNDLQKQANLI